jgi:hypothetical protein
MSPSGFYGAVYDAAKSLGATDVQAHLAAAQASNETGYGANVFGNNYFGVKAFDSYQGPSAYASTTEEINGTNVPTSARFRTYDSLTQSVADYMGMMAANFPDAWNASTVKEATDNLNNGVNGKYATKSDYASDISKIANKYGPAAEQNSTVVEQTTDPVQAAINAPYTANGLTNGVTSLTAAPATAVTSTSVPASAIDPAFSPNGLLSGNFPASSFQAPSTAPMGVQATGDFSTPNLSPSLNGFADLANAGVPGGMVASPSQRMGLAEGFDPSRFAGPVASTFDPARLGTPDQMAQVMATPTATLDAPEAHPNVNNFADMAAAGPVSSPMGVQGILGAMNQPNLAASASVPMAAALFSPSVNTPSLNSFADLAAAAPVSSPANVSGNG